MSEQFSDIPTISYEGPESDNPMAFKFYNPDKKIGGKTMKEHLRFSVAFWQAINSGGSDPFGGDTAIRPWDSISDPMEKARVKAGAIFELADKLGVPFYCFHDRDVAPEGSSLKETEKNLDEIAAFFKEQQEAYGIELLWGTANLFGHPRFLHGAATSSNAEVYAYAAAQVKKAMEVTKELGGSNYVFWGGREGYYTLLNTDMKLEMDNLARFLHMAVEHAEKIGFEGQLLIEPKPKEPTKHQYDFDAGNIHAFLRAYDLIDHFKINLETNHATLAMHEMAHELRYARVNGLLGSVDANQGDLLLGWDTDQFPTDLYMTTAAMYEILQNGGLAPGGLNFDAKYRRSSIDVKDMFYSHIAGMDAFARGLEVAHRMLEDRVLENFIDQRYGSYNSGIGKKIKEGKTDFEELSTYAYEHDRIENDSGRQELLESVINRYLFISE
ncbi:MAG: xylose isomerase [Spirochaetaceae bacterium]